MQDIADRLHGGSGPLRAQHGGEQGADVASLAAELGMDEADLVAILDASRHDAEAAEMRQQARHSQENDTERQLVLALASSREADERLQMMRQSDERNLQMVLELSAQDVQPTERLTDNEDELERALKASEEHAAKEAKKEQELRRREDDSELFQAALRASRVDLGPRGISQAAKIMATGDTSLGQAAVVLKTNSHAGAGGRFNRSIVTEGAEAGSAAPKAAAPKAAAPARPTSPTSPKNPSLALPPSPGTSSASSLARRSSSAAGASRDRSSLRGAGASVTAAPTATRKSSSAAGGGSPPTRKK